MGQITKENIVGARVTDVHSTFEDFDGCDCTTIYFTVDRGFTFIMPWPGYAWETVEIPPGAERLPDAYVSRSYKIDGRWPKVKITPDVSTTIETIKHIKQRTIAGVYTHKMDEKPGFYEPDDSLLLLDDGTQLVASQFPHVVQA